MSDKQYRYIGFATGCVVILILWFLNDKSFRWYGLFASSIKDTMVFDILVDMVRPVVGRSSSRDSAYFLWFVSLGVGFYGFWLLRNKTGKVIKTLTSKVHDRA